MLVAHFYPQKGKPKRLARAQTAKGVMRQIFAQWRKELDSGVFSWNAIEIRSE